VGLDMAICHLAPKAAELTFAGAKLSLFIGAGEQVTEVEGDSRNIGYQSSEESPVFQNRRIPLTPDQTFYLSTDGLFGQVGTEKGLPFGKKRLRRFIAAHHSLPLPEQQRLLSEMLAQHRGEQSQRDDITVLGFRLKSQPPGLA